MKTSFFYLLFMTVFLEAYTQNLQEDILLSNVNIIDVETGKILKSRDVMISGERISSIEQHSEGKNYEGSVIQATGKYLIPGLWDMHVHSGDGDLTRTIDFPLYIFHGITGIRELSGTREQLLLRDQIAKGKLLGPRMVVGSSFVDGPNPTWPGRSVRVATPEEAHRSVDSLQTLGYDFIKTYKYLSPESYRALHERGRQTGMEISGELPISVSLWEAAALGHRTVEHLTGVELACSKHEEELRLQYRQQAEEISADTSLRTHYPVWIRTEWEPVAGVDPEKCRALYRHLAAHGTWVVPTLGIQRHISYASDPEIKDDPRQRYMPASWWDSEGTADFFDPERQLLPAYEHRLRSIPGLHRAGVGILAGTDLPGGFPLHDELELFVEAGLNPLEALRTATINPALYLKAADSLGTVKVGKLADLVLLNANPLDDISNTQKIQAVISNGRYFSREELDKMLIDVQLVSNKKNRQD